MDSEEPENPESDVSKSEPAGHTVEEDLPDVDSILGTFLSEASLWPVLIVVLGSGGAFGAALIVLAAVDRNPFAMAALVILVGMTADITIRSRRRRGLRNVAKFIAMIWGSAFVFTIVAVWSGIAQAG